MQMLSAILVTGVNLIVPMPRAYSKLCLLVRTQAEGPLMLVEMRFQDGTRQHNMDPVSTSVVGSDMHQTIISAGIISLVRLHPGDEATFPAIC